MYIKETIERKILHIDVNNAFLSWTALELLKSGETVDIREIESVIGGDESRRAGIVLAKSVKAKAKGVITGETLYQARKKCPNVKVYKGNYDSYQRYSDKLYTLLLEYTDKIERYSIDECFLDMTEYLMGRTLEEIALEINKRVKDELGFTVNIGLSQNKLLAKMASDFEKPDKIHTLYKSEIPQKMWELPVQELFMLGKKTVPFLNNINIKTIGELAKTNKELLEKRLGKHGTLIWEYANGIDESKVIYEQNKPKSIGNSITLPIDLVERDKIQAVLLQITELVTYRLRKWELLANTVSVQLRTSNFKDYSHQKKLEFSTNTTKEIYKSIKELFNEMYNDQPIRLIGVRADKLIEKGEEQISFFSSNEKYQKIDSVLDKINKKYGKNTIGRPIDRTLDYRNDLKNF